MPGHLPELSRTDNVGLAIGPGVGLGLACDGERWTVPTRDPLRTLAELHAAGQPRWVWWGRETSDLIARAGLSIDRCWDVATVHRFLFGSWRAPLGEIWARMRDLDFDTLPHMGQLDLLDAAVDEGDPEAPTLPNGHLRAEWIEGGYSLSCDRLAAWAELALAARRAQDDLLGGLPDPGRARSTVHAESAAELLCAEMTEAGLPVDTEEALRLIETAAGPRPRSLEHEDEIRARRDGLVLEHMSTRVETNLRSSTDVRAMLRREGFDLPDTRAWRLERLRDSEPLIDALLTWRKAERIATTYGYGWLDEHVRDGRLRGGWSSSDGAAGRMTASAGLHNLPATMRPVVAADAGHRLVRADLGQIEPRVLAAVSGDHALIEATLGGDLYLPIANRLGVERDIAKVAVLGAMYGATTGESAGALAGLQKNYPVAMELLETAAEAGRRGEDVFTSGGRRVRMWTDASTDGDLDRAISAAAARGRYARNALIQGAAAEFFKIWAITVRRRGRELGAEVVLCLHDELLVHVPEGSAGDAARMVADAVVETAHYWSPEPAVRFVADVSVVDRWSEAK